MVEETLQPSLPPPHECILARMCTPTLTLGTHTYTLMHHTHVLSHEAIKMIGSFRCVVGRGASCRGVVALLEFITLPFGSFHTLLLAEV